jgi:hypothetical protein
MAIGDIEKVYGAKFPADLAQIYAARDGETSSPSGWRLQTLEEMRDCGMKDMLDHGEGEYVLSLGPVLPILTNDQSDLLVVQTAGPLAGRLLFVMHDCGDIFLAFRSLASFLAAREQRRYESVEGDTDWFDYNDSASATEADKQAAVQLKTFHETSDYADGGADFYERAIEALTR